MALKDKVYWESMGWRSSRLPLKSSMDDHDIALKQKAKKAAVRKAMKKASQGTCSHCAGEGRHGGQLSSISTNLSTSGPCRCCRCKAGQNTIIDCPSSLARTSVDSLARTSVDSTISPEFRVELLARLEGMGRMHLGRIGHINASHNVTNYREKARLSSLECKKMLQKPHMDESFHGLDLQTRGLELNLDIRTIDSGLYVKIRSSDMPISMQLHAIQLTKEVLDRQEQFSLMETARALKQGFDSTHGYVWHCVVGASYGSYVTYSLGSSIYFSVGKLAILLFKTSLPPSPSSP